MLNYFQNFNRKIRDLSFLSYLIKCLFGAGICYFFYLLYPQYQLYWSIVSVLLVLAPGMEDSIRLATNRMKANIIGASIGLIFFLFFSTNIYSLSASILLTVLLCTLFHIDGATRSALAGLVIVLINGKEKNDWHIGVYRMASVIIGCLVAIFLSYLFLFLAEAIRKKS